MVYMWSAVSFCYYLITFQLKYLPGDIYMNSFATAFAEIFGILQGDVLVKLTGLRLAFLISYMLSLMGGLLILVYGSQHSDLMPLFCIIARIGVASLFNLLYVANPALFPTLFAATAMGVCNFMARIFTILSP